MDWTTKLLVTGARLTHSVAGAPVPEAAPAGP